MLARALIAVLLIALALALPAGAGAGVPRYASVGGDVSPSSNVCTDPNDPCSLERAVEDVAANTDEVVVSPGTYSLSSATGGEIFVDTGLDIHGVDGLARPVITRSGATTIDIDHIGGADLRHLDVRNTSPVGIAIEASFANNTAASRNITDVFATAHTALKIGGGGWLIRDSVFRGDGGAGDVAMQLQQRPYDVRNVTAIAGAFGIAGQGICGPNNGVFVLKNVIARGNTADIAAFSNCSTAGITSAVHVSFSNYRAGKTTVTPDKGQIIDEGNNQTTVDPLFAADGFHQLSFSPTVDAGTADVLNGPFDIDGEARGLGPRPDIGADETLFAAPPAGGGAGNGGGVPVQGQARDAVKPVASNLAVGPAAFPAAVSGASVAALRKPRRTGTTVTYRLSEPATVRFTVETPRPGRRVGRRCVAPRRSNRTRPRCTRFVAVRGSFTHRGRAGANSFRFTGRIGGRRLAPGSYRLVAVPTDAAGNRGATVRRGFRVIR